MATYNLTLAQAETLREELSHSARTAAFADITLRIEYGLKSWAPYGGPPKTDSTIVFLDDRWFTDRELIESARFFEVIP